MRALPELQREFLAGLDRSGPLPATLKGRTARQGYAVYQNNYLESTVKTLAADFPVIARLVGAQCFRSLARDYRREVPSRAGDLQPFGAAFPAFLETRYRASEYVFLADVASLERAIAECLCEPTFPALGLDALAGLLLEGDMDLGLRLQPASRWVMSRWPVLAIWRANQDGRDGSGVDLCAGEVHLLVQRGADSVSIREVSPAVFHFGTSIEAGMTLAAALDMALARFPSCAPGALLASLFDWQLVCELNLLFPAKP